MAALQDSLNYFCLTNVKEDIALVLISEETKKYHSSLLKAVIKAICYVMELMTQHVEKFTSEEKYHLALVSPTMDLIQRDFENAMEKITEEVKSICNTIEDLTDLCRAVTDDITSMKLPPVRPRVIEFTDAGPGVGSNNFEVRFWDAEIAVLHNSTIRTRIHLATGDQGQNEAERTNSYIGEYFECF